MKIAIETRKVKYAWSISLLLDEPYKLKKRWTTFFAIPHIKSEALIGGRSPTKITAET